MPSAVAKNLHRPFGNPLTVDFAEIPLCEHCGKPKAVLTRSQWRQYVDLAANAESRVTYRQCGDPFCPGNEERPVHCEDPRIAPKADYSYAVQARICIFRWRERKTYEEIRAAMWHQFKIRISTSTVENILKIYEIACAGKYRPEYVARIRELGGIILTIDGMAPLKGKQGLYVAYDYRTGLTLGSAKLPNQKEETIAAFLEAIKRRVAKELSVDIVAIVSDALPSQRMAIERVFPGVPHCLCHFHFYKLVLKSPKAIDSALLTEIRKVLRGLYDIRQYKESRSVKRRGWVPENFVEAILEGLLELSNWKRRPKDPCFTGLELFDKVLAILEVLRATTARIDAGAIVLEEESIVKRLREKLETLIANNSAKASELRQIRGHLTELSDILGDLDASFKVGLTRLRKLRDKLRKYRFSPRCGATEREFIEALMKFVRTKGEHLFNYKLVEGAPTTNNAHELQYKQLKHLLRRVIGFATANYYLLSHGERLVFVNPGESFEGIVELLESVDHDEARQRIAAERKSREAMSFIVHDAKRWEKYIEKLWAMVEVLEHQVCVIK